MSNTPEPQALAEASSASIVASTESAELDLSVVIPVYNEEESLPHLVSELHAVFDRTQLRFEFVLVDDGSKDGSFRVLSELAARDPSLVIVRFRRNFGQTAAMQAGLDQARGRAIATIDADLQNDPADIPRMLEKLNEGFDMVAGWRAKRQDTFIDRKLPSMIANRIISSTTNVRLHDYGCTLKVMTRAVAKDLRLYGEMHRFIPVVASWNGCTLTEMAVNHRARQFGTSKYGIGRTLRVVLDLITVRFIQRYLDRPMQVFGLWGLFLGFAGSVTCLWLAVEKLVLGRPLADRPLLLLGVLLIVVGVQLLSLGLVADVLMRTYYEARDRRRYTVRQLIVGAGQGPNVG